MHGALPDLVIPGFPKCGTHALLHNLGRHPDVHAHPEEVGFFGRRGLSLPAYRDLFRPDRRVNVEKTATYVYREHAMQRMKELLPDAKLVVCLRHPVQWAHSFYHFRTWEFRRGFAPGFDPDRHSFEEIVLQELDVSGFHVRRGCFARYLRENVLAHFDAAAVHYVVQERMAQDVAGGMAALFDALGLPPCEADWEWTHRHHDAALRYPGIGYGTRRYRKAVGRLLELYGPALEELYELLGGEVPEWGPVTDHYRRLAAPAGPRA